MSSQVILATAGYDHTIRFWEATTGFCYRTLQYPDSQVNKLEITADKQWLAAAGNPHIKLFEVTSNNPQPIHTYDIHSSSVTAVGFHKDNKWMFSGSEDGLIKVFDIRAPGTQQEYASRGPVTSVVLHPNQAELISGDAYGNIRMWDLTGGACACELVPEVGTAIRSLTIAMDGSMVIASNNAGVCYAWKVIRGSTAYQTHFEPLHKLHAHQGKYILKCLLSPDSKQLVTTASDKTVKIWNLDNFQCIRTLTGHDRWVWDCVFSVDGAYLVTASSDCTSRLWDLASGEAIRIYSGHSKSVVCCALNDSAVEG